MSQDNELRQHLREPPARDLEYVRGLRDAAVAHVEKVTGEWYGPLRDRVLVLTGNGSTQIRLPGPVPAGSVSAMTVIGTLYPGGTPIQILAGDSNGWALVGRSLVRHGGYVWTSSLEYTVTYQQGLADDEELPADVQLAINQMVALWYEQRLPIVEAARLTPQDMPFGAKELLSKRKVLPI